MASKKEAPRVRRVTIRMPPDLHAALLRKRRKAGRSLNDLLVEAAAKLVGMPVPKIPKGIPGRKPAGPGKGGKRLGEGGAAAGNRAE